MMGEKEDLRGLYSKLLELMGTGEQINSLHSYYDVN